MAEEPIASEIVVSRVVGEPIAPDNGGSDSERGTSKTSTVFAWVGAFLVNAAFVSLVGWGAATNWPIGAILCAVYAVVLFFVSGWLVNRNKQDKPDSNEGNSVLTSLLYLLFVGAVGVTGILVSMNVWGCDGDDGYSVSPVHQQSTYITDTSNFPADVVTWYNAQGRQTPPATFAYMPLSEVTIFQGQNGEDDSSTGLWVMSSGQAPAQISGVKNPEALTLISTNSSDTEAVCFSANAVSSVKSGMVACTNGATGNIEKTALLFSRDPYDLYYSSTDGLLWFRATPAEDGDTAYTNWDANIIYSLDPSDVGETVIMRSIKEGSEDPNFTLADDTFESICSARIMNLALLGFAILPALISSIALYWRHKVPSMPIALYAGLLGFVITFTFVINPDFEKIDTLLRWWFFLSSMVWLLASSGAHLTNRIKASTRSWSINWSGLIYFISVFAMFQIPFGDDQHDNPGSWIGITLVGFLPLMLLSVVTGRLLLLVLGAIGLLVDVWKITDVIVAQVDESLRVPIQFVILALSGLALGMLGYFLSKRQAGLTRKVDAFANKFLGRWRVEDDDDEDTPDHRDGLVLAEEGEEVGISNPKKNVATAIVLS